MKSKTSNIDMVKSMRQSTLETIGLGKVIDVFRNGKLPVNTKELVEKVFGPEDNRGAMVISGSNGIVGAGKVMQFASRLLPFNIPIIALDLPGSSDGISRQYAGLIRAFGKNGANGIMKNVIRISYDGKSIPEAVHRYNPKLLLEAIPEILDLKKNHYRLFKETFPGIHIWSVTSGFPSSQLGVSIAHPAFPHEINKLFEIVEDQPSVYTQLLWSLGLIPVTVKDNWSFVLDVFFCGLMLASLRYHNKSNMPFWKIDKYIRQIVGPNPFRAHDAIGAKGANFLTWSCLHHLNKRYGELFKPTTDLVERKDSGQNWYPPDHFRPIVNWRLNEEEKKELQAIIFGALFQMTSIMLKEKRSDLPSMNAIGELCAQFTKGLLAVIRNTGGKDVIKTIKTFQKLYPESLNTKWYPGEFKNMKAPEWQQLYVNAEHDGSAGIITISRESYNSDVDAELNKAIDWLKKSKIDRVILSGDFHLSTQMVGADTSEFFPAITNKEDGVKIATSWSMTARRLYNEFEISVGFVNGKRCMGGMLELMMHCHYLIATEETIFAMPEVTLPVVPGMEGCHWALRKVKSSDRKHLIKMLLEGNQVPAKDSKGWLVDYAGTLDSSLKIAWKIMQNGYSVLPLRKVNEKPIGKIEINPVENFSTSDESISATRRAISDCIKESTNVKLSEAIFVQANHSAEFMISKLCRKGRVGSEYDKIMQ
ncbi:MAG: enoyl-CoA hydratase/isomerase family protein [Ignavibacteria bacterium]